MEPFLEPSGFLGPNFVAYADNGSEISPATKQVNRGQRRFRNNGLIEIFVANLGEARANAEGAR